MKPLCVLVCCGIALLAGCQTPLSSNSQSPDDGMSDADNVRLVGDVASVLNNGAIRVEGVGLVVDLPGTGGDPAPTVYRAMLVDDLQKQNIDNIDEILAHKDTALVLVQGVMRPGVQKGDKFELELRVPSRSETKSLQGGRLMAVRMMQTAVVRGQVREGRLLARGAGPVLVDPSIDSAKDSSSAARGRVLGGGLSLQNHSMGLVLKPGFQSVQYSALVGQSINLRFHSYDRGRKIETASPKNDEFIQLQVHRRYKANIPRYLRVIRALPLSETPTQRLARIDLLRRQLQDPLTSSRAALRLEAIGHEGTSALLEGIRSKDPEVQFYSAEALAYLDQEESSQAAVPLAEAARSEPAFRVFALTALSAMNDGDAYDQLRQLLPLPSAETRYGAFRALWAMNARDPLVRGEMLGGQFSYHAIHSGGPSMIHVTRSFRPEIVLFGHDQQFLTPRILEAGNHIMVNAPRGGPVSVSRFAPNEPDQKRQVSTRVDDVIRAVVELGGSYPDVVQLLQQAHQSGSLAANCRFEIDAIPQPGRRYQRSGDDPEESDRGLFVGNPLPNLFAGLSKSPRSKDRAASRSKRKRPHLEKKDGFFRRLFARIKPGED